MSSPPSNLDQVRRRSISLRPLLVGTPLAAVLLVAATATPALAQEPPPNCPPGSWFCAEAEKPAPKAPGTIPAPTVTVTKGGEKGDLEPLPPADAPAPPAPPSVVYRPGPPGPPPPPPVVIYQPPPPVFVRPPPPPLPPYYYYRPRPKPILEQRNEWGINLRAEWAVNGSGSASRDPMGGVGFGLRYRPVPAFAVEAGFDFLSGHDYQDNFRRETEFTVNALVFVNPRSRVQLYFEAGLGGAWANVSGDGFYSSNDYYSGYPNTSYTYFGGQAGGGLEFRIARHFAMNIDVKGFIRSIA
jgi:hypothetical protein